MSYLNQQSYVLLPRQNGARIGKELRLSQKPRVGRDAPVSRINLDLTQSKETTGFNPGGAQYRCLTLNSCLTTFYSVDWVDLPHPLS
ncbi:hypothetical protein ON05_002035 [Acaryochloris sp. CCMEE 5410]|nr:hypothetical protein ON05_002035 [Acaryochloris sp. CCMEE 5410]